MPATIEMRVAAALLDETHRDDVVGFGVDALDFAEQLRIGRMRLLLENVEREGDVGGGQLRAVGKTRLGAQQEAIVSLSGLKRTERASRP